MGIKEAAPNRQYTTEFKLEAVRLAGSIDGNPAAKRLGVPQSTIANWVRQGKAGKLDEAPDNTAPARRPLIELEAENARLRRELASAKLDLEIVEKAAARSSAPQPCFLPNCERLSVIDCVFQLIVDGHFR